MKRLFLSFFAFALCLSAFAQNNLSTNIISVRTECDTIVQPNKIILNVLIQSNKGLGKKGLSTAQDKLFEVLESANVDTKTKVFVNNFGSEYTNKRNEVLLVRSYEIELNSMKQVDKIIINAADQNNIANINIKSVENTDFENIEKELTKKALLKSREEAKYQANILGQNIGKAVYISKGYSYGAKQIVGDRIMYRSSSANEESTSEMNVKFRNLNVKVNFEVNYQLLD